MKKHFGLLLLTILILLCTSALAMTQEEWNSQCKWKTNRSTPVYRVVSHRATGPDEDPDAGYELAQVGTLPAGTYLGSRMHSIGDKNAMCAMVNGSIVDYYIPSSAISSVNRTGKTTSTGKTKKTAAPKEPAKWEVALKTDEGNEKAVLLTLGTVRSEIEIGNEKKTVPTAQLCFGDREEPVKTVVSVLTQKTGYVTLRSEANDRSTALGRIPDGVIVAVLEQGETYTKVSYKGMTGYVVTRGLEFHDPEQTPIGEGTLYQKGKKETSIFLRPKKNAKWLAKWPQGEPVIVLAEEGNYYAVEIGGFYGWLNKDYVKMQ